MGCCGACGGQDYEQEQIEKDDQQKAELAAKQKAEQSEGSVETFDPNS